MLPLPLLLVSSIIALASYFLTITGDALQRANSQLIPLQNELLFLNVAIACASGALREFGIGVDNCPVSLFDRKTDDGASLFFDPAKALHWQASDDSNYMPALRRTRKEKQALRLLKRHLIHEAGRIRLRAQYLRAIYYPTYLAHLTLLAVHDSLTYRAPSPSHFTLPAAPLSSSLSRPLRSFSYIVRASSNRGGAATGKFVAWVVRQAVELPVQARSAKWAARERGATLIAVELPVFTARTAILLLNGYFFVTKEPIVDRLFASTRDIVQLAGSTAVQAKDSMLWTASITTRAAARHLRRSFDRSHLRRHDMPIFL